MRVSATLNLEDGRPYIELEDGTLINHDMIGYIAQSYSGWGAEYTLELITLPDIHFIIDNNVEIEVEMIDEFTNPELFRHVAWGEGSTTPKLHKNKIIIHYK